MEDGYAFVSRRENGAVEVTLGGAHSANAYSRIGCRQFIEEVIHLVSDDTVNAVLFRSDRKNFCAGATKSYLDDMLDDTAAATETEVLLADLVVALRETDIPLICSVRGACYGVGLIVAVHSDLVVVDPTARLASVHLSMGVNGGVGIASVLPSVMGEKRARRFLLTGHPAVGADALHHGLATDLAEEGKVDELARSEMDRILSYPAVAVKETKRALIGWQLGDNSAEERARTAEFNAFRSRQGLIREHLEGMSSKGVLW